MRRFATPARLAIRHPATSRPLRSRFCGLYLTTLATCLFTVARGDRCTQLNGLTGQQRTVGWPKGGFTNVLTLPHGLLGDCRHRVWQTLMSIARTRRDGLRIERDLGQVIDVRDMRRVDLAHMAGTTPVGRDVHLARREGKPTDDRSAASV